MRFLILFCLVIIYGCKSPSKDVTPKYITDSKQYTSLGIDYHDIEEVTTKSSKSFLESKFVKNIESPKVIAISNMANETNENIDIESITRNLTHKISSSEKFILTNAITGSGASTDSMIQDARKLRENKDFNKNTTQDTGMLSAPQYSLSGKIRGDIKNIGDNVRVDYTFLFILTDLTTGKVVWDKSEIISKVASKKVAKEYGLDDTKQQFNNITKSTNIESKTPADKNKAMQDVKQYTQECDNGNMESCFQLSMFYLFAAKEYGLPLDEKKGFELLQKVCDNGNMDGCTMLAAIYSGIIEIKTYKIQKDYTKAFKLFKMACSKDNADGCLGLGISYNNGIGVKIDITDALEYYEKGCSLGSALSCENTAYMYFDSTFSSYPPDIDKDAPYTKRKKKDNNKAFIFANKACTLNAAGACVAMGVWYHNGMQVDRQIIVAQNFYKGNEFFLKACDLGNYDGCNSFANALSNGIGVKKDKKKAKQYYKKACDLGYQDACDK